MFSWAFRCRHPSLSASSPALDFLTHHTPASEYLSASLLILSPEKCHSSRRPSQHSHPFILMLHTTCFLLSTSDNWSLHSLYNLSARSPDSLGPSTSEPGADCVGTPSGLPRLWLPVEFIRWGTGRRWEAGRKVSLVFSFFWPPPPPGLRGLAVSLY